MACLSITSNNPNFSFIINKNPNSGMKGKIIRKGQAFGWYSSNNRYNIVFFEGNDEVSFPQFVNQEFAYLDNAQYNSPVFISTVIANFLNSALNKPNELDTPSKCSIHINSVKIKKYMLDRIINYFPKYQFQLATLDDTDNYELIISSESTIYELLNLIYLFSFFFTIWNNINISTDKSFAKRLIRAAHITNAPYYVRYLIKIYAIHPNDFGEFRDDLNQHSTQKIKMLSDTNHMMRFKTISSLLSYNKHIVDFGAGEGSFTSLSKSLQNKNYYAIERDENIKQAIHRKIKKHEWTNVSTYSSLDELKINESYEVIMTEVFEHNELEEMTKILNNFWNDPNCFKIILTTPNKDFNQFYLLKVNELRHDDHKFEMTKDELINYFKQVPDTWSYRIKNLGDEVNDISTTCLVIMERN